MLDILKIIDPSERLLYAIIYQAFLDFAYYPHKMEVRLPAFNFLISGGGYWADHTDIDIKAVFVRYCKENYYERNSHHSTK